MILSLFPGNNTEDFFCSEIVLLEGRHLYNKPAAMIDRRKFDSSWINVYINSLDMEQSFDIW